MFPSSYFATRHFDADYWPPVVEAEVPEKPVYPGDLDLFDQGNEADVRSFVRFILRSRSSVETYVPQPQALSVESLATFSLRSSPEFETVTPAPTEADYHVRGGFVLRNGAGTESEAPAPTTAEVIARGSLRIETDSTFEIATPVPASVALLSRIEFGIAGRSIAQYLPGSAEPLDLDQEEDDIEALLLAIQYLRGDE